MTIDIIGGGIGGLTTAIALERQGFKVRIFEQAKAIKAVGAGIILASNAMQVYDKLGLKSVIEERGNSVATLQITKSDLSPLSEMDMEYFEQRFNVKTIAIHRGELQRLLVDSLDSSELHLDYHLERMESNENGYKLYFTNGKVVQSEVIIGADGLYSKVRGFMFPNTEIREAKQVCWRGVTEFQLPKSNVNDLVEAWGGSERFGFVHLGENKVYWYALKSYRETPEEHDLDELSSYFQKYNPLVSKLIESTPIEQINTAIISDLKPISTWSSGKVCLLGDAAHATTPNMGQGACQAIEDAYALSHFLGQYDIERAFRAFQELRVKKAHRVVNASWNIGKTAHMNNPFLAAFRNQLMRWTPASIGRKQSEKLFQLQVQ